MAAFRLAHLSDLHLPMPDRLAAQDVLSKRVLSYISWNRKRRFLHSPDVLARVMDDIAAYAPDHVAVTGDIVNLSLKAEFDRSLTWLEKLGTPQNVTVIPGNHDRLLALQAGAGPDRWQAWSGDETAAIPEFPFVRKRGQIALIGVNTALPTAPHLATGRVGEEQAARLHKMLATLGEKNMFRIVLIHHPLGNHAKSARKALTDRALVHDALRVNGAELVLHGHNHRDEFYATEGPLGPIPVIGVPSASHIPKNPRYAGGWNLISIEQKENGWYAHVTARRITDAMHLETSGQFVLRQPSSTAALNTAS